MHAIFFIFYISNKFSVIFINDFNYTQLETICFKCNSLQLSIKHDLYLKVKLFEIYLCI